MSPTELSSELNVSEKTLRNWRYGSKGPAFVSTDANGGKIMYRVADVERWLAGNRTATDECA